MTASAVRPEFSIMNVIRLVAVGTVTPQSLLHCQRLSVAGLAINAGMRAPQLEVRLDVVIEERLPPVDRVVTQHASLAEAPIMGVAVPVAFDALLGGIAKHVRVMAIPAFPVRVLSEERESGESMIEEHVVLPRRLVVAVGTGQAEGAVMGIVVLVARQAVGGQRYVEDRLNVTGLALDVRVRSAERVPRFQGVIELHLGPSGADMAGLTLLSEMPLVVVVLLVASDTLHGQLIGKRVVAMAGVALLLRVPAVEQEARITIVIETGVVTSDRTMTVATLVAASPGVGIVFGVAAVAGRGCVGERIVCVAIEARGSLVLADQGKAGCIVIEFNLEPVIRRVAVGALCAERSRVRIVVFVAGKTIARCVAVFLLGAMTVVALILGMMANQGKIGEFVIEGRLIQNDDPGVATFVVGVAPGAGGPAGATILAMESRIRLDVRSDLVVAIEAQCALLAALEALVTVGALLLVLGVGFDDLARHDQCLDLCLSGAGNSQCQSHQESG